MEPLLYDRAKLSHQQRSDLAITADSPGFQVVRLLLEDACQQSLHNIVKLNPEDPRYREIVEVRALTSRIMNDVCATLLKSIEMHSTVARVDEEVERRKKVTETGTDTEDEKGEPLGEKFGSFRMKPRKVATQENK